MTMEDPLLSRWQGVLALVSEPWFNIGSTPITPMRMVGLVVIITLVWWLASALERGIRRLMQEKGQGVAQQPGVYVLARMTRYTVWVVGLLVGFNYIGFDVATLALFGGAVGVGIGLGLQNIFANFISGIVLLLERTLKVGDFVDLQSGVVGTVTEIGMRYTRVTTNDNVDIVVPNSEFINGRVTNWTMSERRRRARMRRTCGRWKPSWCGAASKFPFPSVTCIFAAAPCRCAWTAPGRQRRTTHERRPCRAAVFQHHPLNVDSPASPKGSSRPRTALRKPSVIA